MKKIMKVAVAAVAVALCGAANAEIITWSISGVKSTTGGSLIGSEYIAYVFANEGFSPSTATFLKYNKTTTVANIVSAIKSGDTKTVTDYAICKYTGSKDGDWNAYDTTAAKGTSNDSTGSFSGKAGYMGGSTDTDTNFSIFAVIFDSTSVETANNYMIAETSEGKQQVLSTKTTSTYAEKNLDWGSQANNTWNAVPEPTSGLLLLVGLSALALKRKRA